MEETPPLKVEDTPASIEAVQMCSANAERLYDDSQSVSEPTRVALLELAIEEVAKGYWLYFRVQEKSPPIVVAPPAPGGPNVPPQDHPGSWMVWNMTPKEQVQLASHVQRYKDVLSPGQFETLFRKHEVKLELMNYLLGMFKIVLPALHRSPVATGALKRALPFLNASKVMEEAKENGDLTTLLENFDEESFRSLSKLKNDAIYVGYSERAKAFTLPSANVAAGEALDSLAEALVAMLKGDVATHLSLKEQAP